MQNYLTEKKKKRPAGMFTMKRMKNNISLKNLLKLACILRAKKRRKFHVSINWWKLVYTLYVIYAKGNAGGKIQKNVKKLILLTPFYLKLGKKIWKFLFLPPGMEILKEVGTFLWMSKHSIGMKICMFQCVQYIQNILLRKGRHVLLFSMRFM